MKAILGRKVGMTQVFQDNGELVPVTVIEAGPCTVVDKRTLDKDGYLSVQLGFGFVKERELSKPVLGQFKKRNLAPVRYLREVRVDEDEKLDIGDEVKVTVFKSGDVVDVSGRSRGKGFAGVIKRHNFARSAMSHGSKYHRGVGSLQSRDASRVFPGRKMPGHLGDENVTVKGLKVVSVDPEKNLLLIKGAVPGARGSLVMIKASSRQG
ncbi:MAG TPA: 50S ribosomal protein L3 [Firmicutes bacterium]|nr:50S ribosomal protein L3 [Candidatus Fermentithermobacillaceae bacterium]